MSLIVLGIVVFGLSIVLTGATLRFLRANAILDTPNDRSNHTQPTPRGGGIAIAITLALAWIYLAYATPMDVNAAEGRLNNVPASIAIAALFLCILSWWDDVRPLGSVIRLFAHLAACIAGVLSLGADPIFQDMLPLWLDRSLAVFIWAGFLNFFNFMDGIDGIASVETASIGFGLVLLILLFDISGLDPAIPTTIGAAALGFLMWNRPPAKLFMGDVGSVPLGFVLGWLLILLAQHGAWAAAILLPAYYLADGGLTLLHRAARREKVWKAHREHFYQRAVARRMALKSQSRTMAHGRVTSAVALTNCGLISCAVLSFSAPWLALGLGSLCVILLLLWMVR